VNGAPITLDKNNVPVLIKQRDTFEQVVEDITVRLSLDRAAGKPPTYRNIIVDEASVFWDRFFIECAAACIKDGNRDGRAHHGALQVWTRQVVDRFRTVLALGANLVAIAHDSEADPERGRKAGPSMPNKKTTNIFAADAHLSILSDFEDGTIDAVTGTMTPARHIWLAAPSKKTTTKIRGIPNQRLHELRYWPLDQVIREAGFEP
jgi:hypothetical protein